MKHQFEICFLELVCWHPVKFCSEFDKASDEDMTACSESFAEQLGAIHLHFTGARACVVRFAALVGEPVPPSLAQKKAEWKKEKKAISKKA